VEYTTRTVYGSYLDTCKKIGAPFKMHANTTLNEKFSILAGVNPDANTYPNVRYYGIGIGGHVGKIGASGVFVLAQQLFYATAAALYNQLPFVLRVVGNDLPEAQRQKYALRRVESRGGVQYIAYYLKRLDMTNVKPEMSITTVQDGQSVTTPYVPDSAALNPTPPNLSSTGTNITDGSYVNAKATIGIVLADIDVAEFLNVIDIIYQDRQYAMISEIALCSGVDRFVKVSDAAQGEFNMNEAICVQVNDFVNTVASLQFTNDVSWNLDIGATEPLTKLDNSGGTPITNAGTPAIVNASGT
jgi:hypothetical protein